LVREQLLTQKEAPAANPGKTNMENFREAIRFARGANLLRLLVAKPPLAKPPRSCRFVLMFVGTSPSGILGFGVSPQRIAPMPRALG
jgi:hypothetical protein